MNCHAQYLKLSNGGKKWGQDKTQPLFRVSQDRLFISARILSDEVVTKTRDLSDWVPMPWILWTFISLQCFRVHITKMEISRTSSKCIGNISA